MTVENEPQVNQEGVSALADDALKLFRTGLFVIVIYISIITFTYREGGSGLISNTIASAYTISGVSIWVGALTASLINHRMARRVSLKDRYGNHGKIEDEKLLSNLNSSASFGLLASVLCLLVGLVDGLTNFASNSNAGIPLEGPLMFVGGSFVIVTIIMTFFSSIDLIRERWGAIREILHISNRND